MRLSSARLEKLSDIVSEMGQIFFASVFIGPFFNEKTDWSIVIFGLILAASSWFVSLKLIKK